MHNHAFRMTIVTKCLVYHRVTRVNYRSSVMIKIRTRFHATMGVA